jgi:hypothetical protein
MRVKAYIPGTENVLTGEWEEFPSRNGGYILIGDGSQKVPFRQVFLSAKEGWVIEPILELPTKRDALVRYRDGGGFDNTAWRASVDSANPWVDAGGNFDEATLLDEIKLNSDGKFEIIFEGLDD